MFTSSQLGGLILLGVIFLYLVISKICDTIYKLNVAKLSAEATNKIIKISNQEDLKQVLNEINEVFNDEEEE